MYVDGGIFIEIANPKRLDRAIRCWEGLARGILGQQAISADTLEEAGKWRPIRIILGFVIDLDKLAIT